MQQNVGKFDIPVNDSQRPNIPAAKHNLPHDVAGLNLCQFLAQFKQHPQVISVAVVLDHVNFRASFDRTVEFDTVVRLDHIVDKNFFLYAIHVILADVLHIHYFAGKSRWIRVFDFWLESSLHNGTKLTLAQLFVEKDQIALNLSDVS